MTADQEATARSCFEGAKNNSLDFPDIVSQLIAAGFERYTVDFARGEQTYYLPDGDNIRFGSSHDGKDIGATFNVEAFKVAIREAQQDAPDYTYAGFCRKVKDAGCTGYLVSFPGTRAVYWGRTADTHTEHFPQ